MDVQPTLIATFEANLSEPVNFSCNNNTLTITGTGTFTVDNQTPIDVNFTYSFINDTTPGANDQVKLVLVSSADPNIIIFSTCDFLDFNGNIDFTCPVV